MNEILNKKFTPYSENLYTGSDEYEFLTILKDNESQEYFPEDNEFYQENDGLSLQGNELLTENSITNQHYEKVIEVRRVTKVLKRSKVSRFRCIMLVGNLDGKIGLGMGHSEDINIAIEKAVADAQKHTIEIPITFNYSIPHVSRAKYKASIVEIRPASIGNGVIAGSAPRSVLSLAGIKNVSATQYGSNSIINNAKATLFALSRLRKC